MDILSAAVREEAPFDPATVAARTVVVEVRLAGPPSCGPTSLLAYGVLIDADLDPQTGEVLPAFAGLGVDARLSAECDPGSGLFVSEVGAVEVATDPGGETTLTITTTVADLPALEFNWIAFAQDGADLTRLPESPDVAAWTVLERNLP